jgi:hypothetical protein
MTTTDGGWPDLTLDTWSGTRDAVHMWTQIVGKVRMALEPPLNHWWHVPLYVSARGLTTSLVHTSRGGLEIEFDFAQHLLELRREDGLGRAIPLRSGTVADMFAAVLEALDEVGVHVEMLARPVEVPDATPFARDTAVRPYDADAMHRFWVALRHADRLLRRYRTPFRGKASPVHFFWGAFDLATSRFSGRPAPRHPGGAPNCADWVMEEAYDAEVASCGFWPGGSEEGLFYAYAYPEPQGYASRHLPGPGRYDPELREFVLPYRSVRESLDPDATVLDFLHSTYVAAADLGGWDRAVLEAPFAGGVTPRSA